jgi:hypothetical protein
MHEPTMTDLLDAEARTRGWAFFSVCMAGISCVIALILGA